MKHQNLRLIVLGCATLAAMLGCAKREEKTEETSSTESSHVATSMNDTARVSGGMPLSFSGSDTLWNDGKPLGEPVASFGSDTPTWTSTTAASANRGLTGQPRTVVGEVVDVSCYLQLGKRGDAHIPCGTDCVKNGAPIGVVDAKNDLYMVMAEEHDPRRYGNIALKEAMLPFMAKTVQVTGMLTEREGLKTLYVQGYTLGTEPNQPKSE